MPLKYYRLWEGNERMEVIKYLNDLYVSQNHIYI